MITHEKLILCGFEYEYTAWKSSEARTEENSCNFYKRLDFRICVQNARTYRILKNGKFGDEFYTIQNLNNAFDEHIKRKLKMRTKRAKKLKNEIEKLEFLLK